MPLENHSLINEFPEMRERIHQLKTSDNHFARLFAEYDAVEHAVHRIESGAEAVSCPPKIGPDLIGVVRGAT